jgi:hypothetical protein
VILRWQQGRDVVDGLLARGRLTRVTPNRALAETLLAQSRAHLASSASVVQWDPAGAFTLVYDAARKALTAILVNQGLRAGGDGAHVVLLEAVMAQLDPPLGAVFRPFSWMRPLRNHTQYPAPEHPNRAGRRRRGSHPRRREHGRRSRQAAWPDAGLLTWTRPVRVYPAGVAPRSGEWVRLLRGRLPGRATRKASCVG